MAKWRLRKGTTWRQKLEEEHLKHGKIVDTPPGMQKRYGKGKMLIPKPLDVDATLRKVKKGRLITTSQLRSKLAVDAGADSACPFSTGIFVRIAAEAAEEDRRAGKKRITPYWRVIKDDGKLNENFPGGARAQAGKLKAEGFTILPANGKQPPKVAEFERRLTR